MAWFLAGSTPAAPEKSSPAWGLLGQGSLHAVVNAIAHIDIKPPSLPKQRFVAVSAAAVAVAAGLVLEIRLRFHNHTPQQLAIHLALHQQAVDELGGDDLGRAGEEGLGECWEGVVAMGVALGIGGGYWEGNGLCGDCMSVRRFESLLSDIEWDSKLEKEMGFTQTPLAIGTYQLVAGTAKNDKLTGIGGQAVFGGPGNDILTGYSQTTADGLWQISPLLSGGAGNDTYTIRNGTWNYIADLNGGSDTIKTNLNINNIYFATINGRDSSDFSKWLLHQALFEAHYATINKYSSCPNSHASILPLYLRENRETI